MEEPLGGSGRRKCDELANACNDWLAKLAIACASGESVRDWFDVGVFGYRTDQDTNAIIESAFQGSLAGRTLVPISEIANNPVRIDTVTVSLRDEDTGKIIEMPQKVPIWVEPKAEGGTPICCMLHHAFGVLEEWIEQHPDSFPPIVINITNGALADGDPIPYAEAIRTLATSDGNVLLFNSYLSATVEDGFVFPSGEEQLPDLAAGVLFQMSSILPEGMQHIASCLGIDLQPDARGMMVNGDLLTLLRFLDEPPYRKKVRT